MVKIVINKNLKIRSVDVTSEYNTSRITVLKILYIGIDKYNIA